MKLGIEAHLIQGNTTITLPAFLKNGINPPDFIFIDGGHSIETIASDWKHICEIVGPETVVVFDDYYVLHSREAPENGCNYTIDSLDPTRWKINHLECCDIFADRRIYSVQVELR